MSPEKFAIAVGAAVFIAGSLGLVLHRVVPEKHITGGSKDVIGAVVGLLTLLCALVLGLLIWTAYGVYAGQNIAIETLASKLLQLDQALAEYGPETKDIRAQIRQASSKTIQEVWGADESDAKFVANNFAAALRSLHDRDAALAALHPSTDAQTQALAAAKATIDSISQSRLQMSFALSSPFSVPLILIVVAWATFLFFGYGLTSGGGPTSFVAMAIGALAIASAAYLILDLSSPYSGLFRVSSEPLEQVLAVLGKE